MSRLPEDVLQYLRINGIDARQKVVIRELVREHGEKPRSVAEYAGSYVKRIMRISRALDKPR